LDYVVGKIKSILDEFDHNSDKKAAPKLIEIDVPEVQRMSNVPENFIKADSTTLNSTLVGKMERWNISYFKEFLSQYNPSPIDIAAVWKGCSAALAKKALLLSFIAPYGPFQVFSEKLPYVPSYRKLR
jgi:hypothetical protein